MLSADTFFLETSDIAQPTLLDEDPVTTEWPMPKKREWQPIPRATVLQRLAAIFVGVYPE